MKKAGRLFDAVDERGPREQIEKMRAEARSCIEANNTIVDQIWDIDFQLQQPMAEQKKQDLQSKRDRMLHKRATEDYENKINSLLEKIKNLEINLYGHSEIGSKSPYQL